MFLYENNKCPVCDEYFQQGDDVVVCPECGTPHHRECYNSIGKCANRNLHGSDFVFEKSSAESGEKKKPVYYDEMLKNADALNEMSREFKSEKASSEEKAENEKAFEAVAAAGEAMMNREIDGVKISDISTVVGANAPRYIKKFSVRGKLGWNWSAFFFGPLYFMFRKMYTESLVLMALPMIISTALNFVFSSAFELLNKMSEEIFGIMQTQDVNKISEFMNTLVESAEYRPVFQLIYITLAIQLLIRIIFAVTADYQYRKRVVRIVKTVDEKLSMGDSFLLTGPLMGNEEMSQSEMRNIFLAKQGGVNMFLPFLILLMAAFSFMFR